MRLLKIDGDELDRLVALRVIKKSNLAPDETLRKCIKGVGCTSETIQGIAEKLGLRGERWVELLTKDDYEDLMNPKTPKGVPSSPLCMFHRNSPVKDEFYATGLAIGPRKLSDSARRKRGGVLYVSIMSEHSFLDFDKNILGTGTEVDVLTWLPDTREEVIGFSKHLHEGDDKIQQTLNALQEWDKRISDKIRVYTYDSSPTMQGIIVRDLWALVEIIPYNSRTSIRPALLLRNKIPSERAAFDIFSDRFEALFRSAKPRTKGETPDWLNEKPLFHAD